MELGQLVELVTSAFAADVDTADMAELTATVAAARRLRTVAEAREARAAAAMRKHSLFPEKNVADAALESLAEAGRIVARGETMTDISALADACEQGRSLGAMSTSSRRC